MDFDYETLRHTWRETALRARFRPYPEVGDEGLVFGVGTVLAQPPLSTDGRDDARAHALLSVVAGVPVPTGSLRFLQRAFDQWAKGEKALAQFELAFARLPRLATRDDAWPLFYAGAALDGGLPPAALLRAFGLADAGSSLRRYAIDEPRVPRGHGRQSGEWTFGDYGATKPQPAGRDYAQNSKWPNLPTRLLPVGDNSAGRGPGGRGSIPMEEPLPQSKPAAREAVQHQEVGRANDLRSRSAIGDNMDVHHVPQAAPSKQVIPGYDPSSAPSIALTDAEHFKVPRQRGTYDGTARDLLANDIWNLRRLELAPRSALQQLIELNKKMYPDAFSK